MLYHILTVRPRSEFDVAAELVVLGFDPVVPSEERHWRGAKGKPMTTRLALLPGYVVFGVRRSPEWRKLRAIDGVRAPLYIGPELAIVPVRAVEDLRGLSQRVALTRASEAVKQLVRAGQTARIKDGPFAGRQSMVDRIRGSEARIILDIIGKATPTWVPLGNLEAVADLEAA